MITTYRIKDKIKKSKTYSSPDSLVVTETQQLTNRSICLLNGQATTNLLSTTSRQCVSAQPCGESGICQNGGQRIISRKLRSENAHESLKVVSHSLRSIRGGNSPLDWSHENREGSFWRVGGLHLNGVRSENIFQYFSHLVGIYDGCSPTLLAIVDRR